jgi:phosphoribosyl 1,2-cyclic phosphodiesterase
MNIRFWGVRGSIAAPGQTTAQFGGNTSCIEVSKGDDRLILDMGTGLRVLGLELVRQPQLPPLHILLSHTHWDHIQGLPFFIPVYSPKNEIHIYGPKLPEQTLRDVVLGQFAYAWFPVTGVELAARIHFHELQEQTFTIGPFTITSQFLNHPVLMLGYRIQCGGRSMVYTGDHEPYYDMFTMSAADAPPMPSTETTRKSRQQVQKFVSDCNQRVVQFVQGVDCLVTDSQYTPEEYVAKRGWGHSSTRHALDLGVSARVHRLVLFHHDPTHGDDKMLAIEREVAEAAKGYNSVIGEVTAAREGAVISLA